MLGKFCFELRSASFGEMHEDHPAVGGIALPPDTAAAFQVVEFRGPTW